MGYFENHSLTLKETWLILGNFYTILSIDDKVHGARVHISKIMNF